MKDLDFSDLILTKNGSFFKGSQTTGTAIIPCPDRIQDKLAKLNTLLSNAYEQLDPSISIRFPFCDLIFRVAQYEDINLGKTFFLRRLPEAIPELSSIGLPIPVSNWLLKKEHSKGLLLFSGAQASGKTTSSASFIAARLKEFGGHAITYEHPVEMPLAGQHGESGFCFQTEITSEADLPAHIERTHRYGSPNIVFIGEIRSKYAASEALKVALGSNQQLVVATIHGLSLSAALSRLLAWASDIDGKVAQQNLAQTLAGVIHQELIFDKERLEKKLTVKEFLLLNSTEKFSPLRAKLEKGDLFLDDNIREQKNTFFYGSN